jgi:hypothetical protein
MTISDYIKTIVDAISSPSHTYIEGKVWEANQQLDTITTFPVIYFKNFLTASYTYSKSGRILYADYPVSIEFLMKQDELDQHGSDIDDEIIEALIPTVNQFIQRVYQSTEFQDVAEQTNNQTWQPLYFRDRYDIISAGIEVNTNIRLILDSQICL